MSTGVLQQPWLPKPGHLTSVPTPYSITFSRKKLSDGVKPYWGLLPRANERKHGDSGRSNNDWRESTYSTPTTAPNGSNASVRRTVHTHARAHTHGSQLETANPRQCCTYGVEKACKISTTNRFECLVGVVCSFRWRLFRD